MVSIVLEGEAAIAERRKLLEDGKEIGLTMRERSSQGKKRTYNVQIGMNGSTAWVCCREEVECMQPRFVLEAVLIAEAAELFRGYLERISIRQGLVDPSPLSPAFVEIQPCIEDTIRDLESEFGIKMQV